MPEFIPHRIKLPASGVGPGATEALANAVAALANSYAARRDLTLAARFLTETFVAPRFWLYGAGTHTAALLEYFGAAWSARIKGIIDRDPAGRSSLHGIAISRLDEAAKHSDLPILVAHPFFEAEMAADLASSGVASQRIYHLYLNPNFVALSSRTLPTFDADVTAVILGSTRYITVADAELASVLEPSQTPYLAFDLFESSEARPPFTIMPMDRSIDAVAAALKALRPKLVYLRTKMETDFLAPLVRWILPECRLIHEVWDFSVVFEDSTLTDWLKFPASAIDASRLAECWSVRESDLVVSKWGGDEWAALFDDRIGTALYFGNIGARSFPTLRPASKPTPRLLYAGLLPKPEDLETMAYDYNFLGRLERLATSGITRVTILNSGHESAAFDSLYRAYEERFAKSGIEYGRRVSYQALMEIAADHDFGWLALDRRERWDMGKGWIVPMRFTGYVQAGLPIIINPPWDLCVNLTERFSAGIVLNDDSDEEVARALSVNDLSSMRQGVRDLHEHMVAYNMQILQCMRELVAGDGSGGT